VNTRKQYNDTNGIQVYKKNEQRFSIRMRVYIYKKMSKHFLSARTCVYRRHGTITLCSFCYCGRYVTLVTKIPLSQSTDYFKSFDWL